MTVGVVIVVATPSLRGADRGAAGERSVSEPGEGAGAGASGHDDSGEPVAAGETITTEVPALMAGLRVDRRVAMLAND